MISYLKLLKILVSLNLSYNLTKETVGSYRGKSSVGFKHNNDFSSLHNEIPRIFRAINVVTAISKNKGTVVFVGSTKEVQKFYSFFKSSSRRTVFLTKWFNGLLTNWQHLTMFINGFSLQQLRLLKKSKKLRFLKFFAELSGKEKPALVLVFNYNSTIACITQECLFESTPAVVFGTFDKISAEKIPYKIHTSPRTFYTDWFFFQLLFNQTYAKSL
jgi:hypothetical protein